MRVRYDFSSKKTGKFRKTPTTNEHSVEIPTMVRDVIEQSDLVLEVLDARFIEKTRNFEMEKFVEQKGKKLIFVLNKADFVQLSELKRNFDLTALQNFVLFSCKTGLGKRRLRDLIKIEAKRLKLKDRRANVGVIGYPNTGKSSLINALAGGTGAGTSPEVGFTKSIKKIKLSKDVVIFDTPGVYQEKEDPLLRRADFKKHAEIGIQMHDKVKEPDLIVSELMKQNPGVLEAHYTIDAQGDAEILLEELGKRKNFKKKGGAINIDRAARFVLKDWQEGRITLDYY